MVHAALLALALVASPAPGAPAPGATTSPAAFEPPRELEPGCVGRSVVVPPGVTPPSWLVAAFQVGPGGVVQHVELDQEVAPELAGAVARAIHGCAFVEGRSTSGEPAPMMVRLPIRFVSGAAPPGGLEPRAWSILQNGLWGAVSAALSAVALFAIDRRRRRSGQGGGVPAGYRLAGRAEGERAEGERLVLRFTLRWGILVLAAPALVAALLIGSLAAGLTAHHGVQRLWCRRAAEACTMAVDGDVRLVLPLGAIRRFAARPGRGEPPLELWAETTRGDVALAPGWRLPDLREVAGQLNGFLEEAAKQETFVEEDGPGWARKQRPWNLVALAATLALGLWMWSLVGPWRLVLDRRARVVTLRAPLGRRRRSTEELAGVQVRTPLIDQIEALRRKRRPMPWAQASVARCRLVFLDAAAEAWPVTPWLQHGEAARQLDALAERVSEHLRLPLVPAPQVPRPGAVPPARPSARAAP